MSASMPSGRVLTWFPRIGRSQALLNLVAIYAMRAGVGHVLRNRPFEEDDVLGDHGEVFAETGQFEIADGDAINADVSRLNRCKA